MKLSSRLKLLASNAGVLWNIINQPYSLTDLNQGVVTAADIENLMHDQLGAGWIDRVFATRGKLKPEHVENVMNWASSRTAGKLGPLYELYYYAESDARIGGLIDKRVGAVTRVLYEVTPGNKDNPQSVEATRFLEQYIEDIRFKNFLKGAMDGRKYGVTAFQNIIRNDGNLYYFEDPMDENQVSQSRWWQERSHDEEWGRLYLKTLDDTKKLFIDNPADIHPARLSVFTNFKKRGYYDTTGFMNRVLKLYVAKIWTLTFMMQNIEQFGKPFIWTTLKDSDFKNPAFKEQVASIVRRFSGQRWGVFPEGFELQYLDAASAVQSDMHFNWLKYINTELAITIVGQNLSTEVSGGSFAAATAHADVEERIVEEDVEWLQEQLNDQWLYWLIRINYPDMDKDDYPALTLTPIKSNIDIEKVARGFKSVTELIDVPVEEIRAQLQIRAPRKAEDADEDATGQDQYDEEVIGPSTRGRSQNADRLLRALGQGNNGGA